MELSSGGPSSAPTTVSSGSSTSVGGALILLLGDFNLRELPASIFHDMLGVKMGDIWQFKVSHQGNMLELTVDHVDELRSIQFILMSCLTWFTINPDDIFIPRQEGICKRAIV